jgi:hypothetical protein
VCEPGEENLAALKENTNFASSLKHNGKMMRQWVIAAKVV